MIVFFVKTSQVRAEVWQVRALVKGFELEGAEGRSRRGGVEGSGFDEGGSRAGRINLWLVQQQVVTK